MKTILLRLPALAVALSALFGLCNNQGLAQNQAVPPGVTAPVPPSPTTSGTRVIQPIQPIQPSNPSRLLPPNQTNQPASGAINSLPRAISPFQVQTPAGGGTTQAAGGNPIVNQPNMPNIAQPTQPTQQTVLPPQRQFVPAITPAFVPAVVAPGIGFDLTDRGLTINTLEPTGPFFRSGLRPGDVIVSSYGYPIQSETDFQRLTALYSGQPMPVVVMRDGRQQTINVSPPDVTQSSPTYRESPPPGAQSQAHLGVRFDMGISNGAVVSWVRPHSPAEVAGLRPGDMITALNGERVRSYQHAMKILSAMQAGDRVDIGFSRRVDNQTSAVLDSRPEAAMRTASFPPNVPIEGNPALSVPQVQDGQALRPRLPD